MQGLIKRSMKRFPNLMKHTDYMSLWKIIYKDDINDRNGREIRITLHKINHIYKQWSEQNIYTTLYFYIKLTCKFLWKMASIRHQNVWNRSILFFVNIIWTVVLKNRWIFQSNFITVRIKNTLKYCQHKIQKAIWTMHNSKQAITLLMCP